MVRPTPYGTCALCGKRTTKAAMGRHLASCAPKHDVADDEARRLLQLRIEDPYTLLYWLDVEVGADAKLSDLDAFLRATWLECCGHLSAFEIGGRRYAKAPDRSLEERRMGVAIGTVVAPGDVFGHEYDFGSTTELELRVRGEREGRIGTEPLRLLARNEAPEWACRVCGAPATWIDTEAMYEVDDPFYCDEHATDADDEVLLPVVDSPRMGVCAYGL